MSTVATQWRRWRAVAGTWWQTLAPRERVGAGAALALIALALLWLVALAPALRTLRNAPAQLDQLDAQLAQMQRLALEARSLKGSTPVASAQAAAALRAATERLGGVARLQVVGDRATLTLNGVSGEALRQWLAEARSAARARPVEAQLARAAQGFSGTLVVSFGGGT
jgi:general secretion pathway protein M